MVSARWKPPFWQSWAAVELSCQATEGQHASMAKKTFSGDVRKGPNSGLKGDAETDREEQGLDVGHGRGKEKGKSADASFHVAFAEMHRREILSLKSRCLGVSVLFDEEVV